MTDIAIGINIFGEFHRQNLCIQSLQRLADQPQNGVTLYNIQQLNQPITEHQDFKTIYDKGRTAANTVAGSTSNLPMVRDMFDILAEQGAEYFIFLNSDIILTKRIISMIQSENQIACICGSRLAINHIDSLEVQDIDHSHLQIAGFDVYAINTSWWLAHRHLFPDYVYAVSAWDVDYASRMRVLNSTTWFCNTAPAPCYHIMHEEKSHNNTPERAHNMKLFFEDNKPLCEAWHAYLFETLRQRSLMCSNYTKAALGEGNIILKNFNNDSIHTFCTNWRGL